MRALNELILTSRSPFPHKLNGSMMIPPPERIWGVSSILRTDRPLKKTSTLFSAMEMRIGMGPLLRVRNCRSI